MKSIALILLLFASSFLSALAAEKSKETAKPPMVEMIADKTGDEFEAVFLALMVQHHQDGAKMWKMTQGKTENQTIRELRDKTIPKEADEIKEMEGWLKQWHHKSPSDYPEPTETKQMMQRQMDSLQKAKGDEFDKMFARDMAKHHKSAIEMSKLAEKKATHEEVKKLASQIVESQTKDRDRLLMVAKAAK